jgi:hypothetical protein
MSVCTACRLNHSVRMDVCTCITTLHIALESEEQGLRRENAIRIQHLKKLTILSPGMCLLSYSTYAHNA